MYLPVAALIHARRSGSVFRDSLKFESHGVYSRSGLKAHLYLQYPSPRPSPNTSFHLITTSQSYLHIPIQPTDTPTPPCRSIWISMTLPTLSMRSLATAAL